MKKTSLTLLAAGLLTASFAPANITIPTVFVGDAGNANDSTGYGGVSYDYHIGTYEVTNGEYASFLNSVAATDTHGLYNTNMAFMGGISRSGSSGSFIYTATKPNNPVLLVSFWDAARFSNWLTTGNTETGVYNLGGITNPENNTITRDAAAWANGGVAIASENEWYKAAYYDGSGGYWLYPTQSDDTPNPTTPNSTDTNSANYNSAVGNVTDVGAYTVAGSYYGTFDQGGNVQEWNETVATINRGLRGGSFQTSPPPLGRDLQSLNRLQTDPTIDSSSTGFRVSSLEPIPEPSTYAAMLGLLSLGFVLLRRIRRV